MSQKDDLNKFVEVLDEAAAAGLVKLEKAPPVVLPKTMICGCGVRKPVSKMPVKEEAPGKFYIDNVCAGCEGNFPDSAIMICGKCSLGFGRVAAGTLPSGFQYVAGKVYHIDKCPSCTEGCETSIVLEQAAYEQS